jgi:hypothetical protein
MLRSLLKVPFLLLLLAACDEGLAPDPDDGVTPGMSGELKALTSWPPADSVRDLRIVAFRKYPPVDILTEVLGGTAIFSEQLEYGLTSQSWRISREDMSGEYEYIVAAQQYGDNMFLDWRVVGVFSRSGDVNQPSGIDLRTRRFHDDVDISIDFDNLPPQPF